MGLMRPQIPSNQRWIWSGTALLVEGNSAMSLLPEQFSGTCLQRSRYFSHRPVDPFHPDRAARPITPSRDACIAAWAGDGRIAATAVKSVCPRCINSPERQGTRALVARAVA